MIRTIVFDFGNVIGCFDPSAVAEKLAVHAEMPAGQLRLYLFGGPLEDDYESGRLSTAQFIAALRRDCGVRCPDETIIEIYSDIFRPNRKVCELAAQLHGRYRLFLLSNTNEMHARHFTRQFSQTLRHFDALVFSHEIGARKPQPRVFEHCQRLAGCAAGECLFIDDVPANVAGAEACGWHGIVYRDPDDLRRRLSDKGIVAG